MKRMMTWPLTWLEQLWYIKIWPLTWLVQLWHITIWPLMWLVQPSQNPLACLYKPRVCGNKADVLRWNPCRLWLSLARRGAGLVDSRLTSPLDPSALLREVPLPLFFCGAPPAARGLAGLLFQNLLQTYINKMMWYKDKDRATGGIVQGH